MVHAQTREADRDAALRRIAIVLSSLPAPIASQLLGSVDPEQKRSLRQTIDSLADVDPLERQRALQAFKGSVQRQPTLRPSSNASPPSATGGTDQTSSTQRDPLPGQPLGQPLGQPGSRVLASSGSHEESQRDQQACSPLSFLDDVDDKTLVGLLQDEHPQAVAIVLAAVAPAQAARVLPSLDAILQRDALARIGRLGNVQADVVDEIAGHLRSRIKQQQDVSGNGSGQKALHAILAAMPPQEVKTQRQELPDQPHNGAARWTERERSSTYEAAEVGSLGLSAVDQTHRLRVAADSWSDESPQTRAVAPWQSSGADHGQVSIDEPNLHSTAGSPLASASPFASGSPLKVVPSPPASSSWESENLAATDGTPTSGASHPSTEEIHQHLIQLSPTDLCLALGKVSTRQAMLALCGLPNEIAEAVMAVLPRAHSKQVRRSIASLQSLQLREIDEAKEAVAIASIGEQPLSQSAGSDGPNPTLPMAA